MATEVSTFARTRSENDVVPMDVSVLKDKGGNGKGKDGKGKEGKGKTNAKDDRDKFDPRVPTSSRSVSTVTRSATSELIRKKKRDDEERRIMSAQNS